jgi:hypothetical protein
MPPPLARVELPLAPRRPAGRPLGGVEEELADVLRVELDLPLRDAEIPASSGASGLMLRPTAESSTPKRKPRRACVA